jgi:hypothetical protein
MTNKRKTNRLRLKARLHLLRRFFNRSSLKQFQSIIIVLVSIVLAAANVIQATSIVLRLVA